MPNDSALQHQLVQAIQDQTDVETIKELLVRGATANDVEVMQAFEELFDSAAEAWVHAVSALPEFAETWSLREAADQAAFDLMECIEQSDVEGVSQALDDMRAAGHDANVDMGECSMLALAVKYRSDVAIIELLLDAGAADVNDFSHDAIEALEKVEAGSWKTAVERLFRARASK
ncbi:hypothetical protein HDE76_000014 [Rhodanobacter sp. ANJX3]|uniref:hypothetical protein n=1 Tax=Rhodanobacter sp. ANJX3 TaxID=2723083 RepID=UPI0016202145|nr:hypothetical protein [Rhodanobacter sp. ANJX3]MBB5356832.1 hypothetical protein [Rhodanobacter sp. ANJX3]